MNLGGWDTCSLVSIDLVNQALEQEAGKLIRTFSYREDGLEIDGSFGPWAIVPGGSMRLVDVAMPITAGRVAAEGEAPVDLAGVTVMAQLRLRLIDGAGAGRGQLAFDTTYEEARGQTGRPPIAVTGIEDRSGALAAFDADMVRAALTACLSARADDVGFVFASVDARGTASSGGLACPVNDWAFVEAAGGRCYLALLGALGAHPEGEVRIDPSLFADPAPAYFAASAKIFAQRALLPVMQQSFRPKTYFAAKGTAVVSTKAASLGSRKVGLFRVSPVLRSVKVSVIGGGLAIRSVAKADLALGASLVVTVDMNMRFHLDPATGSMTLRQSGKPKVTQRVEKAGLIGSTLGQIVHLIAKMAETSIAASVAQIATRLQSIANPAASPVTWTGVRDFKAAKAQFGPVIWMADTRPVTPAQSRKEASHEPA